MKYPLIPLCITFCLGILFASHLDISFQVLYLLAFLLLISSIIFVKKDSKFSISILTVFFLLGSLLLKNSWVLPDCHIANFTPYKSESIKLVGTVENDPICREKNISFILNAERFQPKVDPLKAEGKDKTWHAACGRVLVRVYEKNTFSYADKLLLKGKLYRPFSFSKDFDYRSYLRHQGIYSILTVKKGDVSKKLGRGFKNPLKSFAFGIRHRVKNIFAENLPAFSAGILSAIILGERQNLASYVRDELVKSGTVHIIAISGLHLGIAAFITLAILKTARIPRKTRYTLTIIIVIIYCLLTGARTPVVRATIMAVILLSGCLLGREINIFNSLALAALIILTANPYELFKVSFQLSFLSVISIVWLTPRIRALFGERLFKIKWARFLILTFSVSTAAWLGLMPLIAYYFKIVSPVTVLANMIIVPYMSVVVAAGFALALVGMLVPPLAPIIGGSCDLAISILFKINSLLTAIPGAYFKIPGISFAHIFLYYVLIISVVSALGRKPSKIAISGRRK